MRFSLLSVLATLLALALGATTAAAEDFCVAKPRCTGTAITAAQLQARLLAAQTNGQPDRFFLGATTFANGPYAYQSDEAVEINGPTGGGVVMQSGVAGSPVLTLVGGAASVTGVHVEIALNATTGVKLSGASAHDLTVTQLLGTSIGSGVTVNDGATLADSSVATRTTSIPGVDSTSGSGTVADSTIDASYAGVMALSTTGVLSVTHSTLRAPIGGIAFGGRLVVSDTLIDASGSTGSTSVGVAALAQGAGDSTAHVARTTIIGLSATSRSAIGLYSASSVATSTMDVADTAVTNAGMPLFRYADQSGLANLTASRVAHGDPVEANDVGAGTLVETGRLPAPTGFVDASAGDFRLLPSSPLIDAGNPDAGAALAGAVDLDGAPRVTDGNGDCVAHVDVGAYEYQRTGPCTPLPDPVGGGGNQPVPDPRTEQQPQPKPQPRPDRVKPVLSALHVPGRIVRSFALPKLGAKGRAPAIAFRLSERARVTLTFARRTRGRGHGRPGRYKPLHTSPLRISARAGTNRLRFGGRLTRRAKLAPGQYRVTLSALDAAGNRSRAITRTFLIG